MKILAIPINTIVVFDDATSISLALDCAFAATLYAKPCTLVASADELGANGALVSSIAKKK